MNFKMGRIDAEESEKADPGILPGPDSTPEEVVAGFDRMGFNKQEIIAILGSHTMGFVHKDVMGVDGRWVKNPYVWDNTYFKQLLLGDKNKYYVAPSELDFLKDPEMKQWIEAYAEDGQLFNEHYAKAHIKMSELGQEDNLFDEFEQKEHA